MSILDLIEILETKPEVIKGLSPKIQAKIKNKVLQLAYRIQTLLLVSTLVNIALAPPVILAARAKGLEPVYSKDVDILSLVTTDTGKSMKDLAKKILAIKYAIREVIKLLVNFIPIPEIKELFIVTDLKEETLILTDKIVFEYLLRKYILYEDLQLEVTAEQSAQLNSYMQEILQIFAVLRIFDMLNITIKKLMLSQYINVSYKN